MPSTTTSPEKANSSQMVKYQDLQDSAKKKGPRRNRHTHGTRTAHAQKTHEKRTAKPSHSQAIAKPSHRHHAREARDDGPDGPGGGGGGDGDCVADAIRELGVKSESVVQELSGLEGVSLARVRCAWAHASVRKNGRDPVALFVAVMRSKQWHPPPMSSPKEVVKAFQAGLWSKYGGVSFEGMTLKYNSTGVLCDGNVLIPACDISRGDFD